MSSGRVRDPDGVREGGELVGFILPVREEEMRRPRRRSTAR